MKTIMSPLRSQPGVQSFQPPITTSNQRPTAVVLVQPSPSSFANHHRIRFIRKWTRMNRFVSTTTTTISTYVYWMELLTTDVAMTTSYVLSLSFSLYSVWTPVTKQWLELWPKGKVWLFDLGQVKNLCGWIEREWMWYLKRWDEMEKEKYNECTYRVHSWWDRGNLSDLGLECDGCGIWMGWWEPRYLGVFRPFLVEKRAGVGKVLRVRAPTGLL